MINDLLQRLTRDPSWNSLAVIVLLTVATALVVISYTAWSTRND